MPFTSLLPGLKKLSYGLILFFSNELMTSRALTDSANFVPCSGNRIDSSSPTDLGIILFALSKNIPINNIITKYEQLYAQCTAENDNPLHLIAQTGTDSDFRTALIKAPRTLLTAKNKAGKTVIHTLVVNQDYAKAASVIAQLLPDSAEAYFYTQLELAIAANRAYPTRETEARIDQIKLSLLTYSTPKTKTEKKIFKWVTSSITQHPQVGMITSDQFILLNQYEALSKHVDAITSEKTRTENPTYLLQRFVRQRFTYFKTLSAQKTLTLHEQLRAVQLCDLQHTYGSHFINRLIEPTGAQSIIQRNLFTDGIFYRSGLKTYQRMLGLQQKIETGTLNYIKLAQKTPRDAEQFLTTLEQLLSEMTDDPNYTVARTLALSAKTLAHLDLVQPREALATFLQSFSLLSAVNPHIDAVFKLCLTHRHEIFLYDERLLLLKLFLIQSHNVCPEIDRQPLANEYAYDLLARATDEPLFDIYSPITQNGLQIIYADDASRSVISEHERRCSHERQDAHGNMLHDDKPSPAVEKVLKKHANKNNLTNDALSVLFVTTTLAIFYHFLIRLPRMMTEIKKEEEHNEPAAPDSVISPILMPTEKVAPTEISKQPAQKPAKKRSAKKSTKIDKSIQNETTQSANLLSAAVVAQTEKMKLLKDDAANLLETNLSQHARWTHTLNFQLNTVQFKVEPLQHIADIKKSLLRFENAYVQLITYIEAQDGKSKTYGAARQQLETAQQQNDLEPLRKAISDYKTKFSETDKWLKIRENKFNAVINARHELQALCKHHREAQVTLVQASTKETLRDQKAAEKHEQFMKTRAEAKAVREAERAAEREADMRTAFIPPNDQTGAPLLILESLLTQLNRFKEEAENISAYPLNAALLTKTLHLSQQFIYLQLFQALSTLARTELVEKLPDVYHLEWLRNQFAHYFTNLNQAIDWAALADITTALFTPFVEHYLQHHGVQQPPEAILLPQNYAHLFSERPQNNWMGEFTLLQNLYIDLCGILNTDDSFTLDSPLCHAMRMIILQLNEYIKRNRSEFKTTPGMSFLLIYRNQDAHPELQNDMMRDTLINLAEPIQALSLKQTAHAKHHAALFTPAAEFDTEPAPQPRHRPRSSKSKDALQ